jgi:hypothetical protein
MSYLQLYGHALRQYHKTYLPEGCEQALSFDATLHYRLRSAACTW